MQIKRFEACDVQEALRQVKREFGPDAVILSIKELEPEGRFKALLKRKVVEVVAALDDQTKNGNGKKRHNGQERVGLVNENARRFLFEYFEYMVSEGVEETVALDIIRCIRDSLFQLTVEDEIKRCILRALQQKDVKTNRFKLKKCGGQKIAFLGPTGAGKTSTLVKLATAVSLTGRYEVGIINLDTERIGASAQLRTFGEISGIEVLDAKGKRSFRQALAQMKDKDLILIDCPGIGHKTSFLIHELADTLYGVSGLETYFVFPAPTKAKDLLSLFEIYAPLRVEGFIVTKMDEATSVGNVLSVAYTTKLPLCYFSVGQEVPGSLKAASLWELIERIFQKRPKDYIATLPPEELAYRRKRFELLMEEKEDILWDTEREGLLEDYPMNKAVNFRI